MSLVNPLTLRVDQKLMWSALAAGLDPAKPSHLLSLVLSSNIAPTTFLTKKIISELLEGGSISLSAALRRKSKKLIVSDGKVEECLSVDNDDQLLASVLKDVGCGGVSQADIALLAELALETIAAECMDHLSLKLKTEGADLGSDFPTPQSLLEILNWRSAAETSMLLWRSVSGFEAKDLRLLRVTRSPFQVIELMCGRALEFHLEYQAGHKFVKTFRRPIGFNSSSLSNILFDHVWKVGAKYFELVRPWEIEIAHDSSSDQHARVEEMSNDFNDR